MNVRPEPEVAEAWPYWRAILEGYVTLDGADDCSIDDLDLMASASDAWARAQPPPGGKPQSESEEDWT